MKYGVDLSFHKGFPDWSQMRNSIQFAILGITELNGKDASFEHNYSGATANGIPVGGYKYSYARNEEQSRAEARAIVNILDGRPLEMGIWLDLEWDVQKSFTSFALQNIIEGFREEIEAGGYRFAGIYCNLDWYYNYIPNYTKTAYDFWLASYPYSDSGVLVESLKPSCSKMVGWQYSSKGRVPGCGNQDIDLDVWYADIPNATETPVKPSETVKPILTYGNSGNAVRELQERLNDFGFGLDEDGIFGDKTKSAVIRYQEMHGLDPDGIVGPLTWESLDIPNTPLETAFKTLCSASDEWANEDPFWNAIDTICAAWKSGKISIKG